MNVPHATENSYSLVITGETQQRTVCEKARNLFFPPFMTPSFCALEVLNEKCALKRYIWAFYSLAWAKKQLFIEANAHQLIWNTVPADSRAAFRTGSLCYGQSIFYSYYVIRQEENTKKSDERKARTELMWFHQNYCNYKSFQEYCVRGCTILYWMLEIYHLYPWVCWQQMQYWQEDVGTWCYC